jgi:hypothetical protein
LSNRYCLPILAFDRLRPNGLFVIVLMERST